MHSFETLWHTALRGLAHKGQFAPLVQVFTLVHAMLPQAAVNAAGGETEAHWVKHNKNGMLKSSVADFSFETPNRRDVLFIFLLFVLFARTAKARSLVE